MAVKEAGWDRMHSIHLAQNTDEGWALVNTALDLWASSKVDSYVTLLYLYVTLTLCHFVYNSIYR
jgi:hypothetical protein